MDAESMIDVLEAEAARFRAVAGAGSLDAPVPSAPDWMLRDLVIHLGQVHRWANDIVTHGRATLAAARPDRTVPSDPELLDWFADGSAALVDALRAASPDLAAATFGAADSPRHFWARRQAHETAIHRVDAQESAAREVTVCAPEFAADGIDEVIAFAGRRVFRIGHPATLLAECTDGPAWLLRFGGERNAAASVAPGTAADAVVHGTSDDLYRWLWNRPASVTVEGSAEVAAMWRATVRVL